MVTRATVTDAALPAAEQVVLEQPVQAVEPPVIAPEPTTAPVPQPTAVPGPVTPEPSIPIAQAELDWLRHQLAQVRAERAAEITEGTLQRSAQAVYDEEIAAGLGQEDALRIAKRHYGTGKQAMAQQQVERDKQAVAEYLGQKYKVSPALLMDGTSGEHMEDIAQRMLLEQRIAALEKSRVPAQRVDSGNSSRGSNVALTADNIDKLWFDFETQHPGQNNPYDAAYRKSMAR